MYHYGLPLHLAAQPHCRWKIQFMYEGYCPGFFKPVVNSRGRLWEESKPLCCLCDNSSQPKQSQWTLFQMEFSCMNTGLPAVRRLFLSCQSPGASYGHFYRFTSNPGVLNITDVTSGTGALCQSCMVMLTEIIMTSAANVASSHFSVCYNNTT